MLQLRWSASSKPAIWLVEPSYVLGCAGDQCDYVIDAQGVEAKHAQIDVINDTLTIKPVDESNVAVNGTLITNSQILKHGDTIELGSASLEITDPKELRAKDSWHKSDPGEELTQQVSYSAWSVLALDNSLQQQEYRLTRETVIGRSTECDICLPVVHLSRKHAKLIVSGGELFVEDLNSSNGTFVNGQKVTRIQLHKNDELSFDQLAFKVVNHNDAQDDVDKTSLRPALDDAMIKRHMRHQNNHNLERAARKYYPELGEVKQIKESSAIIFWFSVLFTCAFIIALAWFLFS